MYNIQEFRKKNTMLCDYLPWAALIGPGLVLNKDCSMQKHLRIGAGILAALQSWKLK